MQWNILPSFGYVAKSNLSSEPRRIRTVIQVW
jgi:hypothetical protein